MSKYVVFGLTPLSYMSVKEFPCKANLMFFILNTRNLDNLVKKDKLVRGRSLDSSVNLINLPFLIDTNVQKLTLHMEPPIHTLFISYLCRVRKMTIDK